MVYRYGMARPMNLRDATVQAAMLAKRVGVPYSVWRLGEHHKVRPMGGPPKTGAGWMRVLTIDTGGWILYRRRDRQG